MYVATRVCFFFRSSQDYTANPAFLVREPARLDGLRKATLHDGVSKQICTSVALSLGSYRRATLYGLLILAPASEPLLPDVRILVYPSH